MVCIYMQRSGDSQVSRDSLRVRDLSEEHNRHMNEDSSLRNTYSQSHLHAYSCISCNMGRRDLPDMCSKPKGRRPEG